MILSIPDFLANSTNTIFWASAIVGTTLFALRVLMALIGGSFDMDDTDLDTFDTDGDTDFHQHSRPSLKLFSLHSLSGFFMMFGWVGLACTIQLGLPSFNAFLWALLAGFIVMLLTALLFKGILSLQDAGAVFSIEKTVGLVGTVYQTIPSRGQGKIQVVVDGVTRELLAQSEDSTYIESFNLVKVVRVIDHEIVEVVQI